MSGNESPVDIWNGDCIALTMPCWQLVGRALLAQLLKRHGELLADASFPGLTTLGIFQTHAN